MKTPTIFDTFLYRHFKNNGHLPIKVLIQPIEKNKFDPNSSSILQNKKTNKHETELKWTNFLFHHLFL